MSKVFVQITGFESSGVRGIRDTFEHAKYAQHMEMTNGKNLHAITVMHAVFKQRRVRSGK